MTVGPEIAAVVPNVAAIGTAIAPVTAKITLVLPDVVRFLPRRGAVTLSHVLPALTPVLPNVTAVLTTVASVVAQVTAIAADFLPVSRSIARLLRVHDGGYAEHEREQRGDECAVLHGLVLERVVSPGSDALRIDALRRMAVGPSQRELRHRRGVSAS